MDPERRREQYRECMRNHAATLGTYAVDGCGEYTPDPLIPGRLHCVACGCHRNFHRKYMALEAEDVRGGGPAGDSMGAGFSPPMASEERSDSKRTRTKFSSEQKEQMLQFAEKIGWRLQRREGGVENDEVSMFCREIGITRQVFKVWMHNHKNSAASSSSTNIATMSNNDENINDSSKGGAFS